MGLPRKLTVLLYMLLKLGSMLSRPWSTGARTRLLLIGFPVPVMLVSLFSSLEGHHSQFLPLWLSLITVFPLTMYWLSTAA